MIWHVFTNFKSMKPSTFTCFKSKHIVVEPEMLPNYKVDLSKEKTNKTKQKMYLKMSSHGFVSKLFPRTRALAFVYQIRRSEN